MIHVPVEVAKNIKTVMEAETNKNYFEKYEDGEEVEYSV
jgi:hypothetical protein